MTEHEINKKLRSAYAHATPDVLSAVLADCTESKGSVCMTTTKKTNRTFARFAALAACLCIMAGCIFGYLRYQINYAVDATVSLDVNPSVEITVNRKERVLQVTPLNADGEIIVGDMDFRGSDLRVAVNAIIGSMLQNGYLTELANSVLISVDNSDTARGAEMQARLTDEVNRLLQTDTFSGAVLSQTVAKDDALRQLAESYGITVGKAQLIREILDDDGRHTFGELTSLSINELNLLRQGAPAAETRIKTIGTASEKAYIGAEKAKEIAFAHAGTDATAVLSCKAELDTEDGIMVYDVDFEAGRFEYEYEIDAATGKVLKAEKEIDDDTAASSEKPFVPAPEMIGESKAKTTAFAHAGVSAADVTDYEFKVDTDDGKTVYELDFRVGSTKYEYEIDAATGKVLKAEKEIDDDAAASSEKPFVPTPEMIGESKAKTTAFAHAGVSAADVTDYEFKVDTDDGKTVYELDFRVISTKYEYEIDAATGKILKAEKEIDD